MEIRYSYLRLLTTYPRLIFIGLYHTFFSTFGQTVLMAVYVESITREFSLTASEYGAIYGGVTITSALLLPVTGPLIDRVNLRWYSLACGLFTCLGCFVLYFCRDIYSLVVGILLVRHGGQGLFPHCTSTTMARFFALNRGKALGLSNIGFALGEAIFPVSVVWLLTKMSWHLTYGLSGVFILMFFLCSTFFVIKKEDDFSNPHYKHSSHLASPSKTPREVLKTPYFYAIMPCILTAPFMLTAIFFYQSEIAGFKSWDLALFAGGISAFAITRFFSSIVCGPMIDRFTANRLLFWHVLPLALAVSGLCFFDQSVYIFIFWTLCGATVGLGSNIKQAIWAEVFGTEFLGAIRSIAGPFTVLSTAVSPFLLGLLFDHAVPLETILLTSAICILFFGILAEYYARLHVRREKD